MHPHLAANRRRHTKLHNIITEFETLKVGSLKNNVLKTPQTVKTQELSSNKLKESHSLKMIRPPPNLKKLTKSKVQTPDKHKEKVLLTTQRELLKRKALKNQQTKFLMSKYFPTNPKTQREEMQKLNMSHSSNKISDSQKSIGLGMHTKAKSLVPFDGDPSTLGMLKMSSSKYRRRMGVDLNKVKDKELVMDEENKGANSPSIQRKETHILLEKLEYLSSEKVKSQLLKSPYVLGTLKHIQAEVGNLSEPDTLKTSSVDSDSDIDRDDRDFHLPKTFTFMINNISSKIREAEETETIKTGT